MVNRYMTVVVGDTLPLVSVFHHHHEGRLSLLWMPTFAQETAVVNIPTMSRVAVNL